MTNFLLLGLCLMAGILLRHWKKLSLHTPEVLNGVILNISFPALVFYQFHQIQFLPEIIWPALSAWILFSLSAVLFFLMGKFFRWSRPTTGAMILTTGLGNTAYLGYPLIEALFGHHGLKTAVLVDQLGTGLCLATLGIGVASAYSSRRPALSRILQHTLSFPPTLALLVGLLTHKTVLPLPLSSMLVRLGDTLIPLALISVGFQLNLKLSVLRPNFRPLVLGLLFKLILGPALIAVFYSCLLTKEQLNYQHFQITIIQCAMAPMIASAILTKEHQLNTELANLMVGLGALISLISVPLWFYFLN